MPLASDNAQQGASHSYRTMRDFLASMDDTLPGKFEITKEGIVHDDVPGSFDPRTGTGAVLTDIHATPDGPRYG